MIRPKHRNATGQGSAAISDLRSSSTRFLLGAAALTFALYTPADAFQTPSGAKDVLMIRVKYADDPGPDPHGIGTTGSNVQLTTTLANSLLQFAQTYVGAASYGTMTFATIDLVPNTITLAYGQAHYAPSGSGIGTAYGIIAAEVDPLSTAQGYNPANYDFVYYAVSHNSAGNSVPSPYTWPAAAYVGGGHIIMNGFWSGNTLVHELGHAFTGGFHQGYSGAADVLGHTTVSSTRHPFDALGNAGWTELGSHYISQTKQNFGWMPAADIQTVPVQSQQGGQSLVYTVSALEDPLSASGSHHAIKLNSLGSGNVWDRYWLEFRQGYFDNPRLMRGLVVNGQTSDSDSIPSFAIDMTPETLWVAPPAGMPDPYEDRADCPLVIGQTLTDPARELYITPLRKLNADPERIEVELNFGPFQFNSSPTVPNMSTDSTTVKPQTLVVLTATSADLNLDPLSYYWQFHDASGNPLTQIVKRSEPTIEHLWDNDGTYLVTCTVSDRKGGSASASISITVSAAITNTPPDIAYARAQVPLISSSSATATLEASVVDAQSDPVTYEWSLVSAPAGASPTIVSPTSIQTDVTGMTYAGSYVFRFVTSDGAAARRADTLVAVDTPAVHDWGLGKLTSKGSDPVLVPLGSPLVNGGGTFQIQIRGGKPHTVAWLFFGTDAASLRDDHFNSQVYATTNIVRKPEVTLDANGEYTWDVPLTNSNFIGKSRTYQAFFRDGQAPDGTATGMTSAVSLVFSDQP